MQGCQAGTLIVPAFNGRLFSPAHAPMAERCVMSDEVARDALLALSTTPSRKHRGRARESTIAILAWSNWARSTKACWTTSPPSQNPRQNEARGFCFGAAATAASPPARSTPLNRSPIIWSPHASSAGGRRLAVADPEAARARSRRWAAPRSSWRRAAFWRARTNGRWSATATAVRTKWTKPARAGFRRQIAQRCLYGVDLNPTAVQLARLSLWLATLAADKPLTFLDHHLMAGDSLLGASLVDIARRPPPVPSRSRAPSRRLPLFADADLEPSLAAIVARAPLDCGHA